MLGSPGKLNAHAKRTLIERVVIEGISVAEAARMANISRPTAYRWVRRYRREGWDGLRPRSRRPLSSPRALSDETIQTIVITRLQSGRGPQWIGWRLARPASTVHRVLRRWNLHRLKRLDRVTRTPVRYEKAAPGELLHLDVKKLQRVPQAGDGASTRPGATTAAVAVTAMTASTSLSMTTAATSTSKPSRTRRAQPPSPSWSGLFLTSLPWVSASSASSPTTA